MNKIELTDFYSYKFLAKPTYSPNGTALAFIQSSCNEEENTYHSNIWIKQNETLFQLTNMNKESNFLWEDDTTLLFPAMREESEKKRAKENEIFTTFYRISIHGGEAIKAFTLPLQVNKLEKIKENIYLVVAGVDYYHPDYYLLSKEEKEEIAKKNEENSDYEIIEEIPFWFNGGSFTRRNRTGLYLFDSATNKLTRLTDKTFELSTVTIDGTTIYYAGDSFDTLPNRKDIIYAYDLITEQTTIIDNSLSYNVQSLKATSLGIFMFASQNARYGINENPYLYLIDRDSKKLSLFLANEESIGSSVGSDCRYGGSESIKIYDDTLYFTMTKDNASYLFCVDENSIIPVLEKEGSIDGFDIANGIITLVGMYDCKLQELYEYNLNTNSLSKVTSFNEETVQNRYIAIPEKLSITVNDSRIDGWVLKPINYDETKQYPAILDIHGGPKTVYGEVFYHEMQYWASEGYFVFFCNPFGSDGRGNEFADIRGKYGTIDYDCIMSFTDAVLEKYPMIDSSHVAVTGGSYGGFMTNWIIGHTNRFVCAATQRSISNWISFYGISDIGPLFAIDQQAADLYDNAEKLWWHSPLKYAGEITTPTLFIHSDEDYRCPMAEGMQLYTALINRGVPARLCYFKGENHDLSRSGKPLHRKKRLEEITTWIKTYTAF